jgi:hypothetical protein
METAETTGTIRDEMADCDVGDMVAWDNQPENITNAITTALFPTPPQRIRLPWGWLFEQTERGGVLYYRRVS